MTDHLNKIEYHMELSQNLGAAVGDIPRKTVELIQLIMPYLTKNTTPREAGIVMGAVFAYFAAILTVDTNGDKEQACANAHSLLDAAINIVSDIEPEGN